MKTDKKGIATVSDHNYKQRSALWDCLAKALMVFLVVYGSFGCFLSGFGIPYPKLLFFVGLLGIDIILSLLFYNKLTKNIGYIVLFFVVAFLTTLLFLYINSGFYAIVNIVYEKLQAIWQLKGVMQYTERIENRQVTIIIALLATGGGMSLLLNSIISNYMSLFGTIVITIWLPLFTLYMDLQMPPLYIGLLLTGYVLIFMAKRSGHYITKVSRGKKMAEEPFCYRKKNTQIRYQQHGMVLLQTGVYSAALVGILGILLGVLVPAMHIQTPESWNRYKEITDEYVKDIATLGIMGLWNGYESTGGISGGKLGGVSSVRADYETDIKLTYAPTNVRPIYLRAFVGGKYCGDHWEEEFLNDEKPNELFESQNKMQRILVTNVGANMGYWYQPYYSIMEPLSVYDNTTQYYYIPIDTELLLSNAKVYSKEEYLAYVDAVYLESPVFPSIDQAREEAGLEGTVGEIATQIANYFETEFAYTLRPGVTPGRRDFVDYFLGKTRKGLCAHFASAATLMLRRQGIPARYVEGYVATYQEIENGEIVEDADVADYRIGPWEQEETQVITVEIADTNAHAWVEVFVPEFGWVPIEVTPSSDEEPPSADIWDLFASMMNGENLAGENQMEVQELDREALTTQMEKGLRLLCILLAIFVAGKVFLQFVRIGKRERSFHTASRSRNLENRYEYLCERRRRRKKQGEFGNCVTQSEQFRYYVEEEILSDEEARSLMELLQIACYSDEEISTEQYETARRLCKKLRRPQRKRSKQQSR